MHPNMKDIEGVCDISMGKNICQEHLQGSIDTAHCVHLPLQVQPLRNEYSGRWSM